VPGTGLDIAPQAELRAGAGDSRQASGIEHLEVAAEVAQALEVLGHDGAGVAARAVQGGVGHPLEQIGQVAWWRPSMAWRTLARVKARLVPVSLSATGKTLMELM
jgi:hypothetical protein